MYVGTYSNTKSEGYDYEIHETYYMTSSSPILPSNMKIGSPFHCFQRTRMVLLNFRTKQFDYTILQMFVRGIYE